MKVLLTGGGTGGHITPILAVAHELKQAQSDCETIYVGERGGKFASLTQDHDAIDRVFTISAGKLRRYHGESWLRRVTDIKTIILNIRDGFKVLLGVVQAWRLLGKVKPDVVFLKGGFVGVPIGLTAALKHIPIVTHDSDIVPGLANRMVSRWARIHATALPAEFYNYPSSKVIQVGVLVEHNYQKVNDKSQAEFKLQLNIPTDSLVLLITGGSSGAERINLAMVSIMDQLLRSNNKLLVIHQVGKGKADVYQGYHHDRLRVLEFLPTMYVYTGAADLIVTRAGANAMAEFGVQGKACIVVPNPDLTGGHQIKNAKRWEEQGVARVVTEEALYDTQRGLYATTSELLASQTTRTHLAEQLNKNTITNAAHKLSQILIEQAVKKSNI